MLLRLLPLYIRTVDVEKEEFIEARMWAIRIKT